MKDPTEEAGRLWSGADEDKTFHRLMTLAGIKAEEQILGGPQDAIIL